MDKSFLVLFFKKELLFFLYCNGLGPIQTVTRISPALRHMSQLLELKRKNMPSE
jgi:hypothetical protein